MMNKSPVSTPCSQHRFLRDRHHAGFSLIELMIVVALVAILASIALPNYNEYVLRSHRANARAALVQASQWMERAATAQGRYPDTANVPAGILAVQGNRYNMTVVSNAGAYVLTATPVAGQANDRCGTFQLNQAGVRTQLGGATLTAAECWNR
jgi:type IV pilus assembly protein PilE